jgi:hypothetical protein
MKLRLATAGLPLLVAIFSNCGTSAPTSREVSASTTSALTSAQGELFVLDTNQCFQGSTAGQEVTAASCTGAANQLFSLAPSGLRVTGGAEGTIVSSTGLCLDSSVDTLQTTLAPCNQSGNQEWSLVAGRLQLAQTSNACLTLATNTNTFQPERCGVSGVSDLQRILPRGLPVKVGNALVEYKNITLPGFLGHIPIPVPWDDCLDLFNPLGPPGTAIQAGSCDDSRPSQLFTWTQSDQLVSTINGRCVTTSSPGPQTSALALQDCNGSTSQLWIPQPDYQVVNINSNVEGASSFSCLDMEAQPGGMASNELVVSSACQVSHPAQQLWNSLMAFPPAQLSGPGGACSSDAQCQLDFACINGACEGDSFTVNSGVQNFGAVTAGGTLTVRSDGSFSFKGGLGIPADTRGTSVAIAVASSFLDPDAKPFVWLRKDDLPSTVFSDAQHGYEEDGSDPRLAVYYHALKASHFTFGFFETNFGFDEIANAVLIAEGSKLQTPIVIECATNPSDSSEGCTFPLHGSSNRTLPIECSGQGDSTCASGLLEPVGTPVAGGTFDPGGTGCCNGASICNCGLNPPPNQGDDGDDGSGDDSSGGDDGSGISLDSVTVANPPVVLSSASAVPLSISVAGLTSTGLRISDGAETMAPSATSASAFPTHVLAGTTGTLAIVAQPTNPGQLCTFGQDSLLYTTASVGFTPPTLDVTCGPTCVLGCADGTGCNSGLNCASFTCTNGVCAPPSCAPFCNDLTPCGANGDCASDSCVNSSCAAPSCAPTCGQGAACGCNADCGSASCIDNVCAPPSCAPTCGPLAGCGTNSDCTSGVCSGGHCQAPACSPACSDGSPCYVGLNCSSLVCTNGACLPPSCAPACATGAFCGSNTDCGSRQCVSGHCL